MNAKPGSRMDLDYRQRRFQMVALQIAMHRVLAEDPELERTPEGDAEYRRLLAEFRELREVTKSND